MRSGFKCGPVSLLPVLSPQHCGGWSRLLRKGGSLQTALPSTPFCIAGPGRPPGPRLENRHSPLCQARSGKGRAAAAPARSPSQGTGSRADGWLGCRGAGTRHRDLGLGGLGVAWRSREGQGAPCPQLCQAVKVRRLAATVGGGTQWETALTPGSLLKGPGLLQGLAVLGSGHGRSQPFCPGV